MRKDEETREGGGGIMFSDSRSERSLTLSFADRSPIASAAVQTMPDVASLKRYVGCGHRRRPSLSPAGRGHSWAAACSAASPHAQSGVTRLHGPLRSDCVGQRLLES